MAEQIPFSIMENILMKLGSSAGEAIGLAFGLRKEIAKVQETLSTIRDVLLDAEEQQGKSHAVENWVRRLKDVIYDADDLLDDFTAYELRRQGGIARQVSDFFSSSNPVGSRFKMGHKIADIKERLDGIANDISKFNFIPRVTANLRVENSGRETHSFVLTSEIMGRDEDKKKMVELLLQSDNEDNLLVVAIVGIGGLGKTTLAQLVYNDVDVVKHFDLRLWVCVSDDFDVKILVRNILKSGGDENVEHWGLEQLKNKLHKTLNSKRYLLVLDDIWNEDFEKWNQLRILLKVGARGSKVVVTTRSSKVASIMAIDPPYVLKGLNHDQSWALFKNLAFGEEQQRAHQNLLKIGEEITKMCLGVPLVIKTLGRILHSKTEESQWLSIKNNKNLMSLQDGNNILSVLKLSYDNLPTHLKQCFTYHALFPKDSEIDKKKLIQLWMAQGYIQPLDENEQLEDVGDQYLEEFLSRSLFQEVQKDDNNNVVSCKMHDLIHDLAQSIIKSEIITLTDDTKNISERIHHVSILEWSPVVKVLKAKPIRTLLNLSGSYSYFESTIISNCKRLRVLSLSGLWRESVPKCLVKLDHLRYLDLSYNFFEVLPSGFTNLQNLQTLRLQGCGLLKKLPRNMRKLINLRHLEIDGSNELLRYMPYRLGELTELQTLPLFVIGDRKHKGIGGVSELKHLNNLRGGLWIKNLEGVKGGTSESKEANLKEKHYLQSLRLDWGRWVIGISAENDELVMEGLQPNLNLKKLKIEGYPGVRFPSWFSSMLTSLQCLELQHLPAVEYMLENSSSTELLFASLKALKLVRLLNFKGWCRSRREIVAGAGGEQAPSFPSLSELMINRCDQLTTFQLLSSPCLSKLDIKNCRNLESLQLPSLPCLKVLILKGVHQQIVWQIILVSSSLKSLYIERIYGLVSLLDDRLQHLTFLKSLKIERCDELESLFHGIQRLSALEELRIFCCKQLNLLDKEDDDDDGLQFQGLRSLRKLEFKVIPKLESLPKGLRHVTTLETLTVWHCSRFTTLPDWISTSTSISYLQIYGCLSFKLEDPSKIAHIQTVNIG